MLAVPQPHWACPWSQHVYSLCPHWSDSKLLHREPSKAGPGLHAHPRSKPLRFRHLGSPQMCRLGWTCVLCPFQVQAAQATRCYGKCGSCDLLSPLSLPLCFLGVLPAYFLRWMSTIQNPKKFWLAMKPSCSNVDDASLGPGLLPSGSGCPHLPISSGGWASPQLASSTQLFVQ